MEYLTYTKRGAMTKAEVIDALIEMVHDMDFTTVLSLAKDAYRESLGNMTDDQLRKEFYDILGD